eukprot:Gb_25843 [translate_table: standard]
MRLFTAFLHHNITNGSLTPTVTAISRNGCDYGFSTIPTEGTKLCRKNRMKEARSIFKLMDHKSIQVDFDTCFALLQACIVLKTLENGKQIHAHMLKNGIGRNVVLDTKLVIMYAKCGSMVDAHLVFDRMLKHDVSSWTAMIGGYTAHGNWEEAIKLFYQMKSNGIQGDNFVFPIALNACAGLAALQEGKAIHDYIIRSGLESDVFVGSALVDMYAKCGNLESARQVFDKMSRRNVVLWNAMVSCYAQNQQGDEALKLFHQMQIEGFEPNVISWTTVIAASARNGCNDEALKLFRRMQLVGIKPNSIAIASVLPACANLAAVQAGKEIHGLLIKCSFESDVFVQSAVIDMYTKCGDIAVGRHVFDKLAQRNLVSWNTMISGYSRNGNAGKAMKLFHEMKEAGVKANVVTIASVLSACATFSALKQGKGIHAYIIRSEFTLDVFLGSSLVDMYAKSGSIENARHVFDKMSQRNVVLWNAMIGGYAMHGHGEEALTLFYQMQQGGINPDKITFTGVLSSCSHAGLLDEGWQYFNSMSQDYHITPSSEHYACMVDLLGRAGHLDEAYNFISNMLMEPDACIWGALLGACRIHGNVKLGERVAEHLFESEPQNAGNYVLLSNIYAAAGRWCDVAKLQKIMKETDPTHNHRIYAIFESLDGEIVESWDAPNMDSVLFDLDEEKRHILCCHSKKLAIGLGLVNICPGMPIQIIKDLLVTSDCHAITKLIQATKKLLSVRKWDSTYPMLSSLGWILEVQWMIHFKDRSWILQACFVAG